MGEAFVATALAAGADHVRDVVIPDTEHHDFHDYALISPTAMKWLSATGSASKTHLLPRLNGMLVDWLDTNARARSHSAPTSYHYAPLHPAHLHAFDQRWFEMSMVPTM